MPRFPAGINSQIEISILVNKSLIAKGEKLKGKFQGEDQDDPVLSITSDMRDPKTSVLNLKYQFDKDSPKINLQIKMGSLKSRLGYGGDRLLFICPISGRTAKTLYLCNRCHLFIHKRTYNEMSHYPASKLFPITNQKELEIFLQIREEAMHKRMFPELYELVDRSI